MAGVPVTEVAGRYGVSRQSVHAWLRRYREEGPSGLADRSHRVLPASLADPGRGGVGGLRAAPGASALGSQAAGLRDGPPRSGHGDPVDCVPGAGPQRADRAEVAAPQAQDYTRWERPVPMQLWQMDVTASAFLAEGREVKIVTGIDDHSRYCVIARAVLRATARPVCQAFVDAMAVYGVPEEMLTDNGTVLTGRFIKPRPAEVLFERICRENGVTQRLTRPASPTTTGKIERLHQSMQIELLDVHGPFESLQALQAALDAWRQEYNTDRPHQSLGMAIPALPVRSRGARAGAAAAGAGEGRIRLPRAAQRGPQLTGLLPRWRLSRHRLPWRLTGSSRRRGTCRSAGSKSGSARRWQAGRSPSGSTRPACMSCWTATRLKTLPSRLGVTELARLAADGARPAGPSPPGRDRHGGRGGADGQRPRAGRPGRRPGQRRLRAGRAAGHRCGWTAPRWPSSASDRTLPRTMPCPVPGPATGTGCAAPAAPRPARPRCPAR